MRCGDWNAKNHELMRETEQVGAPYYQKFLEAKRKHMTTTPHNQSVDEIVEQLELITTGFAWWSNKTQKEQVTDLIRRVLHSKQEEARDAERERIVDEYGWFNDGCGCCSESNLRDHLLPPNQNEV